MKVEIEVANTMSHNELKEEYSLVCTELHAALDLVEELKEQMAQLDTATSAHTQALDSYLDMFLDSTSAPEIRAH